MIIGLFIVIFLVTGGLGAWSLNLNSQIGRLNSETQTFKQETTTQFNATQDNITSLDARLAGLDARLAGFKSEVSTQFNATQGSITGLDTRLVTFKSETATQFNATQAGITSLDTRLATFKTETASQFAESTMNIRKIYEGAIKGVVQITDGKSRLGSGFVLSAEGHIVTAHHVIDKVTKIDVILHDGSISKASIVGSDKISDIAVLKLESKLNLEPLKLADSNTIVNGEPVIVVGSPFALYETVNSGIISRKKGTVIFPGGNWLVLNLIQFDAATNPGNSGGPVVNSKGQVIGMAAYNMFPENGIAWAVSSNKVNRVARSIIDKGSFTNARLPGSWSISALTPEAARDRGLETGFGALFVMATGVGKVEANDIVVAVDGIPVTEPDDLFNYIGEYKSPGDTITLTLVIRGGIKIEVPIKLVEGWMVRR